MPETSDSARCDLAFDFVGLGLRTEAWPLALHLENSQLPSHVSCLSVLKTLILTRSILYERMYFFIENFS